MRTLYQFPLSHFCEKARWLLDHKELYFVAKNPIPGVHRAFAQLKTGQNNLPILHDQGKWIAESTHIALYLDDVYPEHGLLRSDPKLRQQALDIDELANELGVCVRSWGLAHALLESDESLEIMIGEKGYLRKFEKYSKPIIKSLVSNGYKPDSEKVNFAKQRMDEIVEILNAQLVNNSGRYMVGDRLGLADIAVCSMLAPLLQIPETPWERENQQVVAEVFQQIKNELMDLPLGQYIKRIYMNERHARVDWRGI
jgi:glutathione S-transferase